MSLAELIADYVTNTCYEEIPRNVLERTKTFLLDLIGTAIIASTTETSKCVREVFLGFGGKPESSVISNPNMTSCICAAFINGFTPEIYDWTPDHQQLVHPSATNIPVALALAESQHLNGKAFLESVVTGFEVSCRISEAFLGLQFYTPYPPVFTVFGPAVTAAKALDLNERQTAMALGIGGSRGEGLQEWKAGDGLVKPLHVGFAAMSGLLSAMLAEKGLTGPRTILEGRDGYLKAYSYEGKFDSGKITYQLGQEYRMMHTAFKPYPVCNPLQPIIENTLHIVNANDIKPENVEKVFVKVSSAGQNYPFEQSRYKPQSLIEAQFSIPYVVAAAIVRRRFSHPELDVESLNDPMILKTASKVEGLEDSEYTEKFLKDQSIIPVRISVRTRDKNEYGRSLLIPKGDPHNLSYDNEARKFNETIEHKFRTIINDVVPYMDDADNLIATATEVEKLDDMQELTNMLKSEPSRKPREP